MRLLWVFTTGLVLAAFAPGVSAEEGYSIAKIRAHLYFHETGEIGTTDLINGKDVALWNTIIGEGLAGKPSNATWVVVEVSGPKFTSDTKGKLTVTVTAKRPKGNKVLAKQTSSLSDWFSEGKGGIRVPLLVYGTGCDPLEVTASLSESKEKGKPVERKSEIPFACGE